MSDELGFNKIAGAILATALAYMGIKELAHAAYHPHAPEVPAYGADLLAEAMKNTGKSDAAAEPLPFPQPSYVAAMDPAAGEKVFAKCKSCHSIEQGGANATGPNLYGILNNPIGAQDGFGYSAAFKATDLNWGYEELDAYLAKPRNRLRQCRLTPSRLMQASFRKTRWNQPRLKRLKRLKRRKSRTLTTNDTTSYRGAGLKALD